MAKWMNKMGLAAINFNIDDSKIAGFNRGFLDSKIESPVTTPVIGKHPRLNSKNLPPRQISSPVESEYDSDKESYFSWQRSASHHSSISDIEPSKDKVISFSKFLQKRSFVSLRRNLWITINKVMYLQQRVILARHHQHRLNLYPMHTSILR